MALWLGPHPDLGPERKRLQHPVGWLWLFPILALVAIAWGLADAASGRPPRL